ncbi:MAG: flavodoxin family protein [Parvularculaceae bacterium]
MSDVIVITGSARRDGHTRPAVDAAFGGSRAIIYDLNDYEVAPYDYACSPEDDFLPLAERMITAKAIVFATPVYWYSMSAPMKVFFDRLTDLTGAYKQKGRALAGRRNYLLAAGGSASAPEGFVTPFRETALYFDMEWGGDFYAQTPLSADSEDRAAEFGKRVLADAARFRAPGEKVESGFSRTRRVS